MRSTQLTGHGPGDSVPSAVLAIAGLSFWFFLGFPFGSHNESYAWMAQLNRMPDTILDVLRWSPAANYRPLGSIVAWLGYRLSGGSVYPQQLFNFVLASLAWLSLYYASEQRKLFAWVALVVGGLFFSGYIYLFHLHGVFYSPLLLFTATLIAFSLRRERITTSEMAAALALAILTALFHPFALLVYMAFTLGRLFESGRGATRTQFALGVLGCALAFLAGRLLMASDSGPLPPEWTRGLTTSYSLAEVRRPLSIVSWLLSVVTIVGVGTSWRTKVFLSVLASAVSVVFIASNLPVVMLWVAVCLGKALYLRKWSLALLLAATAAFPAAKATGSPTYAVFALMTCSAIIPLGWTLSAPRWPSGRGLVVGIVILGCAAGVLARTGVRMPVLTKLVNPVLAEREKTLQLERIITWWRTSSYSRDRLVLCQKAQNPAESADAVNREHRPPTYQIYLDEYADSLRPTRAGDWGGELLLCFGAQEIVDGMPLFTVPGKFSGRASVYRQPVRDP